MIVDFKNQTSYANKCTAVKNSYLNYRHHLKNIHQVYPLVRIVNLSRTSYLVREARETENDAQESFLDAICNFALS